MFHGRSAAGPGKELGKVDAGATGAATVVDDGPWIASCAYWSAARTISATTTGVTPHSDVAIGQAGGVKLQPTPSAGKTACGTKGWGIPEDRGFDAQISVVIATVPDPIHSHLALDFDRTIDALLQAGARSKYLGSNYWLPWRSQIGSAAQVAPSATKPTPEDEARERQPGLIVLRYAPGLDDANKKGQPYTSLSPIDYRRVIYLFLVAETPALGVNGNQLQNAFSYAKTLQRDGAKLSIGGLPLVAATPCKAGHEGKRSASTERQTASAPSEGVFSIIGPLYSGSAASLRAGIEAALGACEPPVSITGTTGTEVAAEELDPERKGVYRSFGEDVVYEQRQLLQSLGHTGYDIRRVAVLTEAGTVFGTANAAAGPADEGTILNLRFPRELSLLRNAEPGQSTANGSAQAPTPYLNLSLKDYSADDTVPRFSTIQSPLSIEAQLMAIAQQLKRARSQFIVISASNVLDDLFLAQFLRRACPDARLVVVSGEDLLFEHDPDNASYIGSIAISPYLLSSLNFGSQVQYLYPSFQAEGVFNAALFTFHHANPSAPLPLAGYRDYSVSDDGGRKDGLAPSFQFQQIPLWATVVGADGYYPLAILSWCASDSDKMMPTILSHGGQARKCAEDEIYTPGISNPQSVWKYVPESINQNSGILPSLPWGLLAGFITFACIGHCIFLLGADLWSPLTRDLAIDQNDSPYRRAVHINIGTSVLASIAFVTSYPLLRVGHYFHLAHGGYPFAWMLLVSGTAAVLCTAVKTWCYRFHPCEPLYGFFNLVAAASLVGTVLLWTVICNSDQPGGHYTYAGLYFCYRCLRPLNKVCPLLPILLLLSAWYLWSIYQTARLRFSAIHRPRLARLPDNRQPYWATDSAYPLFVPDNALERCAHLNDACLYQNISSLLISREVIRRLCGKLKADRLRAVKWLAARLDQHVNPVLGALYCVLFILYVDVGSVRALDHFLFRPLLSFFPAHSIWHVHSLWKVNYFRPLLSRWPELSARGPTLYEFFIAALFFPLVMVALSGWLRVILIWGALSRGLLEPLERVPLRFAFSRFDGGGWFSMLRQKGLHVRLREMARSTESIRQLVHHPELKKNVELRAKLEEHYEEINCYIYELRQRIEAEGQSVASPMQQPRPSTLAKRAKESEAPCPTDSLWDLPEKSVELCKIYQIEQGYARFCSTLIEDILSPYWDKKRTGLVEDISLRSEKSANAKEEEPSEPTFIELAEELVVIRYVALIHAVLINIRYLMLFVSTAFVFAIVAWNSYPFQPHAFIDQCFTILLAILTLGFVWVFAQMHRNAILSRITNTSVNELGWEFF